MPDHHLPDEFLLEYASGAADPGHALMVACHATLCPRCRARIAEFEAIGGAVLGQHAGEAGEAGDAKGPARALDAAAESVVANVLASVRRPDTARPTPPAPAKLAGDGILPLPLIDVLGPLDAIEWKHPIPGLEVHEFTIAGAQTKLRMTRVKPDALVGFHDHAGRELDLVLAGGLVDVTRGGEFERGDIQYAEPGVEHDMRTQPDEPCLVFTVNEGPVVPRGPRSQLIYRWLGWNK